MANARLTEAELRRRVGIYLQHGSNTRAASALGITRDALAHTLRRAQEAGILPSQRPPMALGLAEHDGRLDLDVADGIVLVGSDAHIWPGDPTPAMRAFEWAIAELKPRAVILNGDVFDGATVSRFPSIGWERKPRVIDEIEAVRIQLDRLRSIGGAEPDYIWTLGNHDLRFETRVANSLPEFAGVFGVHLRDHFPDWRCAWACWINDAVCVKHRYKGGVHAPLNNTKDAGVSIVTGHLHSLQVSAWSDYRGTRWGVDCGTLAQPYGKPFIHYTEGSPTNWRAGFAVLTFAEGQLVQPEVVAVRDSRSWDWRGRIIHG